MQLSLKFVLLKQKHQVRKGLEKYHTTLNDFLDTHDTHIGLVDLGS